MDVDHVAAEVGVAVPHLVEDGVAAHDLSGSLHEQQQDVELAGGQLDLGPRTLDTSSHGVDEEITGTLRHREPGVATTVQRSQPRQQFLEIERFRQVVVCAGVEAVDAIADGGSRGQEQDRYPVAVRAQGGDHGGPLEQRQHPVEKQDVELAGAGRGERSRAVGAHRCLPTVVVDRFGE